MKFNFLFVLLMFICSLSSAQTTITALTDLPTPVGADVIVIVDDVAGTPTTKKATLTNVLTDANIPNTITIDLASTATALAANGANCSAGQSPLGVDASGAVESCFDVWTEAENTSAAYLNATSAGALYQPLDSDLTTIAGLTATTNNFIVSVSSAWASRTPAEVKTTLSLNNVENTALSTWAGSTNLVTLGADAVDALTEIAQSIKTAANDTSKLVVGTAGAENDCAKWDASGNLVTAGAACGAGGGYTNLTQFVDQTAWRVFYSNTDGDVVELALGADGTFLKSNGATSAPTFATPAGSGDVSKVGTPVNNQVGVWTGDGTLEGDTALTFDTATDILASGGLNLSSLTASEIVITDASKNLISAAVATYPSLTELTYLKGVTSAIQTQLNGKQASGSYLTSASIDTYSELNTIVADVTLTHNGLIDTYSELNTIVADVTLTHNGLIDTFAELDAIVADKALVNKADGAVWLGTHDFGGATLEIPNSITLPATCAVGQSYMDTDATTGQRFYLCESTNTWALQGDGGGGAVEGTAVLSTGEVGGTKFLREDGDGTSSWQTISGGGDALVANPLSQFAATTSAQFAGVISDETGTGVVVLATTPTLVTPVLGVATATTINKVALTAPATGSTLTIADGSTLTVSASATISNGTHSGTNTGDQTTITGNAGTATALAANGANCSAGSAPLGVDASGAVESCTDYEEDLSNSAGLLAALSDETGTGVAVFSTSPTLVTPVLGVASGTSVTTGTMIMSDGLLDGVGAVDMDYGSVDITDHTFVTDGTGTAEIVLPAGSIDSTEILDGTIVVADTAITAGRSLTWSTNDLVADAELYTDEKCIVIETPTDADNFIFFRTALASTITSINCIVENATSAVITVQECDTAGDNCTGIDGATTITCDVDGQADDASLSNAGIDATDWIRLDVGTVTGTPGILTACITLTRND